MNTPVWVTLWTVVVTIAWQNASLAQAQLSGTSEELREFLYPRPHTVNITGEGELHAYKDVATVSLLITTEDRELSVAMSQNQSLRDTLINGFTAAEKEMFIERIITGSKKKVVLNIWARN